jgi:two-component system cell cycle response regulator DivK
MEGLQSMSRKKILIVEDVDLNVDLFVQLLEDEYDLVIAKDGEEGVRKAEETRPDLILMDFQLPVLDGWGATRKIKANPALRHIPIIAVTSHAMASDASEASQAGCDDYLPKPIEEDTLLQKIKKLI